MVTFSKIGILSKIIHISAMLPYYDHFANLQFVQYCQIFTFSKIRIEILIDHRNITYSAMLTYCLLNLK